MSLLLHCRSLTSAGGVFSEELGKFLTKMDDAGELLVMMLSSKTIQDTVEVIRVFKFLHRYGF